MTKSELDITMPGIRAPWAVSQSTQAVEVPVLVVAWSDEQPERIGEFAFLAEGDDATLLGRGPAIDGDPAPRLTFGRVTVNGYEEGPAVLGPRLSRRQVMLRTKGTSIEMERLGSCPTLVNGQPLDRATLRFGDTLTLKDQLVLFVGRRTRGTGRGSLPERLLGEFARADAWGIVGESSAAWKLRGELGFIGRASGHVIVLGESGVGKELAARAIHALSDREAKPLIARSAATIPDSLIDAELFGNVGNYPNPGMRERPGLIGEANKSSLFLDEIGELPEACQARLLRVLDSGGEYSRLGEARPRVADLRLIAATNRPIDQLKSDFGARFPLTLRVPGLNERRADIPLLIRHLLVRSAASNTELHARFFEPCEDGGVGEPRVAPDLVERLIRHNYSTHVRELEQLLWKAILSSHEGFLLLTPDVLDALSSCEQEPVTEPTEVSGDAIRSALGRHEGNITRAARELGLKNRYVLYRLMKKHGIDEDTEDTVPEVTT
ncbi:MAG: DNA-binding NtrC family response regulator [Bradymonadia bacterium]|jgi:DNA-binding NtrC family response regulator